MASMKTIQVIKVETLVQTVANVVTVFTKSPNPCLTHEQEELAYFMM